VRHAFGKTGNIFSVQFFQAFSFYLLFLCNLFVDILCIESELVHASDQTHLSSKNLY
jgi:hypothetical protein